MRMGLIITVCLVFMVAMAGAATIEISNDNLVWDQESGNYTAKVQYDSYSDGYYLNEDYSASFISGWQNGTFSSSNASRNTDYTGRYWLAAPANTGSNTTLVWKFDFSATEKTISSLSVRNYLWCLQDGTHNTSAECLVSTDGTNWTQYMYRVTSDTYTSVTDGGAYTDLTEYVQGSDVYYIKIIADHYWAKDIPQLFRSGTSPSYNAFVNDVTLVPEPATMCLLTAGTIGVLRIKRRK